jgi:hypothetical protein
MKGVILELSRNERKIIKKTFHEMYSKLKPGEKAQYELAFRKLDESEPFVDGLFMRCYENVLLAKANDISYQEEKLSFERLAEYIKQQRENFQLQAMSRLGLVAI